MSARVDLGKLTFGNDDAERDAKQGAAANQDRHAKISMRNLISDRLSPDHLLRKPITFSISPVQSEQKLLQAMTDLATMLIWA